MSDASRTYSTSIPALRLALDVQARLDAYARHFSRGVRTAYAQEERAIRTKSPLSKALRKAAIQSLFSLTSRQANAVLVEADAKRAAILALYDARLEDLQSRLRKNKRQLKEAQNKMAVHRARDQIRMQKPMVKKTNARIFRCTTKIASLEAKIARLTALIESGHTSLTFGTKTLLRARSGPDRKGLDGAALVQWQEKWDVGRNNQFYVLGSKDETAGCQGCVTTAEADGTFSLRIRLPDAVGGGFVVLKGIKFAYGEERLRYALDQQLMRAQSKTALMGAARATAKESAKTAVASRDSSEASDGSAQKSGTVKISQKDIQGGVALTWRFMRQADGAWRISFSTSVSAPPIRTHGLLGSIGVDINSGFITVAETDRYGNIKTSRNIYCAETGRTSGQRDAARGEAVKSVIAQCVRTGKPLVLEKLDFKVKKRELKGRSDEKKRKLSALAYRALHDLFSARALDAGVAVHTVNPAYTSTQGQVRYAAQRGWTVHMAAAGVIARRGQGISEVAPVSGTRRVPVGKEAVEWTIPVEIARSNVSRRWPLLHRSLQQAIAAHFRERRRAAQPRSKIHGALCPSKVAGETPALNRATRPAAGLS